MPRPLDTHSGYPQLARILATELAATPHRIAHALETLADARSPLKANSYEAIATRGTGPDPRQTETAAKADHDRRQLKHTLSTIDTQLRGLTAILNEWAPQPLKPKNVIWCENHLRHGHHEPRNNNNTQCRWCSDVKRAYGVLPTRQLLELHDRGRRITETEYRRLLGRGKGAVTETRGGVA